MTSVIDATYRVVTPLFCAGADPDHPELRATSFKGVLRFWWRALAWGRCGADLDAVLKQEDTLFGSAGGGQSRVSIRLDADPDSQCSVDVDDVLKADGRVVGDGARYLGYGVMGAFGKNAGRLTRACLRSPFDFTVRLRAQGLNQPALVSLTDALLALGILGGMGAKSRKGYGSLVLRSLTVDSVEAWTPSSSVRELKTQVAQLHLGSHAAEGLPQFSALSQRARHVLLSSDSRNPVDLLDRVGREMIRFRSWGHNGRVLGENSERRFRDDRDLMKRVMNGGRPEKHPRRVAFGLPHNYGKRKHERVEPSGSLDRRASPLFIHIHDCGGTPVAVLSFLPARFLPTKGSGRAFISVGGTNVAQASEEALYRPVDEFLDRLIDPRRKDLFADRIEVRP